MPKIVITDLDGTLLRSNQTVSEVDYQSLVDLGKKGVVRVIATGRSTYSFSRVIPAEFPIDYLVFSSGTGVMDYNTKEILNSYSLSGEKVEQLALIFQSQGYSFKILAPVPDNHHYLYYENGDSHPDFYRRMEYYRGFESPISFDPPNFGEASQFLIILPPDVNLFNRLKDLCNGVKVVRATSPIDHESIWMELFHPDVSKAKGVEFLCNKLDVEADQCVGIGNDYNDLDLLEFTAKSFVVSNSPDELIKLYKKVSSNDQNGFTCALEKAGVLIPQ